MCVHCTQYRCRMKIHFLDYKISYKFYRTANATNARYFDNTKTIFLLVSPFSDSRILIDGYLMELRTRDIQVLWELHYHIPRIATESLHLYYAVITLSLLPDRLSYLNIYLADYFFFWSAQWKFDRCSQLFREIISYAKVKGRMPPGYPFFMVLLNFCYMKKNSCEVFANLDTIEFMVNKPIEIMGTLVCYDMNLY